MDDNPYIKIFCSFKEPDTFRSIEHASDVLRKDPYDIEEIHKDARDLFERQLYNATTPYSETTNSGCVILLKGESGSGKTHLMRSFRNNTHSRGQGYFAYMQMTTFTEDYSRYILNNLITAFDSPYYLPDQTSAIIRLSNLLIDDSEFITKEDIALLREMELDFSAIGEHVYKLTNKLLRDQKYQNIDAEIISSLFYLQTMYPEIRQAVYKYLRCQPMTKYDQIALDALGTIQREQADPFNVIVQIGKIIYLNQNVPLIICIDQIEDVFDDVDIKEAEKRFRNAIMTINKLSSIIPSSIMIISCLSDCYDKLRNSLTQSAIDRIENDPNPITIEKAVSQENIRLLIGKRLKVLFEKYDIMIRADHLTYPIPEKLFDQLSELSIRNILINTKKYRESCAEANKILPADIISNEYIDNTNYIKIDQEWNDFQSKYESEIPHVDKELYVILEWAIMACAKELGYPSLFQVQQEKSILRVINKTKSIIIGICNKNARGGALGKQIKGVMNFEKNSTPVIVRSTDFPNNPKTAIATTIAKLIESDGRRVVVQDSDWRIILAMKQFIQNNENNSLINEWIKKKKVLCSIYALNVILDLERFLQQNNDKEQDTGDQIIDDDSMLFDEKNKKQRNCLITDTLSGPIDIGYTKNNSQSRKIDIETFKTHAVFLGGTGSGKTTVALNIIEQLLLRGIPAILIDRKGDLCGYAKQTLFQKQASTKNLEKRKTNFNEKVEVEIYTPGNPQGKGLSISIIPEGLAKLREFERDQIARFTSEAIAGMMLYTSKAERKRIPVLSKAISLLSVLDNTRDVTLDDLIDFIGSKDPNLVNAIGCFDDNLFKKLAEDLRYLKLNAEIFLMGKEKLNAQNLFGLQGNIDRNKTRLSIISTKFLGSDINIQFYISQLLMEVTRWANKNPSKKLQAVLFFDEADMYLPAQKKPSTKEPMENLLKRARSSGIGLFLASQNPGDFDYKCRDNIGTWFVGRVQEKTSLSKMKPMFDAFSANDIEPHLSGQRTGEFHLIYKRAIHPIKSDPSLLNTEQISDNEILKLAHKQIEITCPKCGKKYKVDHKKIGKKGKCKECNFTFKID